MRRGPENAIGSVYQGFGSRRELIEPSCIVPLVLAAFRSPVAFLSLIFVALGLVLHPHAWPIQCQQILQLVEGL